MESDILMYKGTCLEEGKQNVLVRGAVLWFHFIMLFVKAGEET